MSSADMSPGKGPVFNPADPAWLPMRFDPGRGEVEFVHFERLRHSEVTFLSDEYLGPLGLPIHRERLEDLQLAPANHPHFIFHSAFCRSTLLARLLDMPGISMGMKEPRLLIEMAQLHRQGALADDALQALARLLGRPFAPGEAVILKPGNEANVLADRLLEAMPGSRGLLLFAPLPRFLSSVARKGMWGRIWSRRLFALLRSDTGLSLGFDERTHFEQTDLQLAGLAWLLQHAHFLQLLRRFPDQLKLLDSETLIARKAESLAELGELFGLALSGEQAEQAAASPVFREDSKKPGEGFEGEPSTSEVLDGPTRDEIGMVEAWVSAVADHGGVELQPPPGAWLLPPEPAAAR